VYQESGLNLAESRKPIIFEVNIFLGLARVVAKIGMSLKSNLQIRLRLYKSIENTC